jgi:hypothetical protein
MARPRNDARDRRIAALHADHKTEAEISEILVSEGHEIGPSGVHRALRRLASESSPASKSVPAPLINSVPPPATLEGSLRKSLRHLERAAESAERKGDTKFVIAAARAITQLGPALAKLTPPAPPSVDTGPNMAKAGKLALERMHASLDRLLKEVAP